MPCPCETRTSTWRSFATISSGLYRFLAIAVLLDVKDIPQVGPLQWGRINFKTRLSAERISAPSRLLRSGWASVNQSTQSPSKYVGQVQTCQQQAAAAASGGVIPTPNQHRGQHKPMR